MGQFLHISFVWRSKVKSTELVPVFDLARDWYRYSATGYVVWTTATIEKWYERLKPKLDREDSMLIAKINPKDLNGWMPQAFWDWFKRPNPTPEGEVDQTPKEV